MPSFLKRLSISKKPKTTESAPTDKTAVAAPSTSAAPATTTQAPETTAVETTAPSAATTTTPAATMSSGPKIALVIHSLWGHIAKLSDEVEKGLKEAGAQVTVYQFEETLSEEALGKMYANKSLTASLPVITPDLLAEADGFVFGFGTRYGRAPAQVSTFFDRTGSLWASGKLVGKFGSVFTSSASQHGGQETTALTTIPFFTHHGVNFVPIGFQFPELSALEEIGGGSAYGAGTISAGDGSRQPTANDLKVAKGHGLHFGKVVAQYVRGKQ